jgi:hypothetical protein
VTAPGPGIERDAARAATLARSCNESAAAIRDAQPLHSSSHVLVQLQRPRWSVPARGIASCAIKGYLTSATLARSCNESAAAIRDAQPPQYGFFASVPSLFGHLHSSSHVLVQLQRPRWSVPARGIASCAIKGYLDAARAATLARSCNESAAAIRDAQPPQYGFFASVPSI